MPIVEIEGLTATLVRSRRRTLAIEIERDLALVVRSPLGLSVNEIEDFVRSRKAWIERHRARLGALRAARPAQVWAAGSVVPYLGGGLELSLRSGGRSSARLDPPFIAVTAQDPSEADEIREAVERLYARQAALVFPSLLEACLLRAAPRRLPRPELRIRRMKARWGSCDTAKRIVTLNVHLLRYAPEAIEYVIMHELAHLRWRGHGPRFYALLAALCPRWKELRSNLKETPID